ncbi:DUF58 domain-containing protein [Arthrobacter sp. 35W]|uniref:DUF58 domain-containing protein n=1 Tax=Arthrobacter sp. 35W TaxID=1132441 RepID=UPI00047D086E|nr:DUF58 domain-containing protein [Arthrobacter sp. 35W]
MAVTGRLVLLALAGLVPILAFPSPGTVLLWVALLVASCTLDLVLAASPRAVALQRIVPEGVRLGQDTDAELLLTNTSNRTLRALVRDGWQPSAGARNPRQRTTIGAHERRRLIVALRPIRRGEVASPHATIRSFGPLGLAARQATLPLPGVLRVLPPFNSKRHLPGKLRLLRELDGKAAVQIRGAGTEFDSLRDYVQGDDVRSIDWRATARRRDVVVRTWRPERDRRVVIVLDTSRTSAARIEDEPRLDTGIEAALLLAALADRGGDRVDFAAFDRRVRARVSSAAKGNLLSSLVRSMAPLQPQLIELDYAAVPGVVRSLSSHRALVVLLTSLDAGSAEEGLIPLVSALVGSHVVVVASVRDPALEEMRAGVSTVVETYRAAAAEHALLERGAVASALRQLGAEVVDADPHQLPPQLADAYIRLKAAGRL